MFLLVDADTTLVRMVERHLALRLPGTPILNAANGLQALALGHAHGASLRVITVDVALPLMDGRVLAAALRRVAPQAAIVPFTEQPACLSFFREIGAATPIMKPVAPRAAARALILAHDAAPQPLPETAWFTAMCAQAETLLNSAAPLKPVVPAHMACGPNDARLRQAQALLLRYAERTRQAERGREIAQSLKLIEQCLSA